MKKIKVVLILCPAWTYFCPPIGLAYLSAVLKKANYEVKPFDLNVEFYNSCKDKNINYWDFKGFHYWMEPEFSKYIRPLLENGLKAQAKKIIDYGAQVIGFSVFDTNTNASLYLAEEIKKISPGIKIIFGGQECFRELEGFRFLKSGFVDAVVIGEGEKILLEMLDAYSKTGDFSKVRGVLTKNNGEFVNNGFQEEVNSLDSLPMPDFEDFNLTLYKDNALPIMTSRGCIACCAFCGEVRYWKKYRFRSAENIFAELKHGVMKYGVKRFYFNDSLINGNLDELIKLADLIIENKLQIIWGGYARINKRMGLDIFKKLKQAGCIYLSYGIESGSQKVLNDMNKMIKIKDAEKNLVETTQAGIGTHVNWVVGFPSENWIDYLKSLLFIYRNRKNITHFNPGQLPCGILQDSVLANNAKKFKISDRPFLSSWRTKYYTNTIIHRNIRLKLLRKWLSLCKISYS